MSPARSGVPDDPDSTAWFDGTGLPCPNSVSGHLCHRPDGRCNWRYAVVMPALTIVTGPGPVDVSGYSRHDRRQQEEELRRLTIDVNDADDLDWM